MSDTLLKLLPSITLAIGLIGVVIMHVRNARRRNAVPQERPPPRILGQWWELPGLGSVQLVRESWTERRFGPHSEIVSKSWIYAGVNQAGFVPDKAIAAGGKLLRVEDVTAGMAEQSRASFQSWKDSQRGAGQ